MHYLNQHVPTIKIKNKNTKNKKLRVMVHKTPLLDWLVSI